MHLSVFIWRYLKKHTFYLVMILLLFTVSAIAVALAPYFLGRMVFILEAYRQDEHLSTVIMLPACLYVLIPMVKNVANRVREYIESLLYPSIKCEIKSDMFSYLLRHSSCFFENNASGGLVKKIVDMPEQVELLLKTIAIWVYKPSISVLLFVIILYVCVGPIYAVILLSWTVLFVGISFINASHIQESSKSLAASKTKSSGVLLDSIHNIATIKLLGHARLEQTNIQKVIDDTKACERTVQRKKIKILFYQGTLVTLLIASFVMVLIYDASHGKANGGSVALVFALTVSCLMMLFGLGQHLLNIRSVMAACQDALSFMRIPHEISDRPDVLPLKINQGEICFQNVKFSYHKHQVFFQNLNLKIKPGESIGIVGSSGSGKSTLLKLLLRLIEPDAGQILIDGQNIKAIQLESLYTQITTIPQQTDLFHRSILDNIRFARIDASDEAVILAAKKAKCHEFIMALPEQYNTLVGERGMKLSGGQRQRLAIARAFLKNTNIFVIDEATSALDIETELAIQESLTDVMYNKTTIIVSHRLSILRQVDTILVFDSGRLIEQGSLQALLAKKDGYFSRCGIVPSDLLQQAEEGVELTV